MSFGDDNREKGRRREKKGEGLRGSKNTPVNPARFPRSRPLLVGDDE